MAVVKGKSTVSILQQQDNGKYQSDWILGWINAANLIKGDALAVIQDIPALFKPEPIETVTDSLIKLSYPDGSTVAINGTHLANLDNGQVPVWPITITSINVNTSVGVSASLLGNVAIDGAAGTVMGSMAKIAFNSPWASASINFGAGTNFTLDQIAPDQGSVEVTAVNLELYSPVLDTRQTLAKMAFSGSLNYSTDSASVNGLITDFKMVSGSLNFSASGISTNVETLFADYSANLIPLEQRPGYLISKLLSGNDVITGTAASDYLAGYSGNDSISGGAGNDTLSGGLGADTLIGGVGNDTYRVSDSSDVVQELASSGLDVVMSYVSSYTLGAYVENAQIMSGGAANLTGNPLNNKIYAGYGSNLIDGRLGNDTVSYEFGGPVTVSLATTVAQATGSSGSDTLLSIENLIGSAYADKLTGNIGNNLLDGSGGSDTISGGAGNDRLFGGDGNDILIGGPGSDVLSGGSGVNTFVFDAAFATANIDTISGFSHGQDKIQLDDDIFTKLGVTGTVTGIALASMNFRQGTAALDADDRIIYDIDSGALYYDADGIGAGVQLQFATVSAGAPLSLASSSIIAGAINSSTLLVGHPVLSASDFLIIS